MTVIDLKQSQYFALSSGEVRQFTVRAGVLEIFACTPEGSENYHKMFLAQLEEGESFFSPVEMLSPLEFQIFARSDCLVEEAGVEEVAPSELARRGTEWFKKLASLPWVRYLAGIGDETASKWDSRTIFGADKTGERPDEGETGGEIQTILAENVEIFSMLVTARFKKIERDTDIKTAKRGRHRDRMLAAAMQNLLRTEYDLAGDMGASAGDADDTVRFAVCAAARFLGMETENVSLPSDVVSKMDPVTRMRRLIKKANMQVRLVSLPKGWRKDDIGVLLGYYGDENEIVALLPRNGKSYVLVSEKHPVGLPVNDEVASQIKDDAFMCYAGLPPRKLGTADMFRFMLRHSTKHDWTMVWIMSLVAGFLPILMPLITENIFRDVIPINDRQALGTVAQVMLLSGVTTAIVGFVRSIALLRIKSNIGVTFESALWSRLLSLPVRFFRDYDAGNLVGRMQGVGRITELLGDNVLSAVFNMIFSFWSLVLMFYYNVKLTLIAMTAWLLYLLVNAFLYRKTVLAQRKMTEASNKASARTLQLLNGLTKFRLQGGEASAFHLWSQTFGEQWQWNLKSRWYSNYTSLINVMMPTALSMLLFYMTMSILESGGAGITPEMDAAKFMGFQSAFSGFNATLVAFVPVVSTLFSTMPFIENIMPILETEPEGTDDKVEAGELSGEIELRNLHFAYAPDSPMVLRGISLHIKAGESVAFVGASGCGKSTLVRVLLGFEKPTQGVVSFDGQDFSMLNAASVRSQMGVVLQNGQIMAGDIFSNIVGSSPLSVDDAWEAARMVGLDKDIENMPMGMNTMISEGAGNISGGQRQRILLARSIVSKPKIVILDEATSALDNVTQAIVTESMNKLRATRIIVAHRLSTIKDVDRICVLKDGCLIEEGNYEELMKMGGLFAQLANRQIE
ncbi:MAG: NHLP bacteriocin export ABC transporter permease/ATPase subunit [Synergistaceae bacterium]|jgi:ATP-binding cassette subfamily C protein|nr:NHLP bacteriocin export ABC transporter permease/ATPase subunit [Synergistaceae bacterium]